MRAMFSSAIQQAMPQERGRKQETVMFKGKRSVLTLGFPGSLYLQCYVRNKII